MNDVIQRILSVFAIIGSLAIASGVLFNAALFWTIDSSYLSTLSLADHTATAAAHLPYFFIGYPVLLWLNYNRGRRLAAQGFLLSLAFKAPGKHRILVEASLILLAVTFWFFGFNALAAMSLAFCFWYFWLYLGDEILGDHFGVPDGWPRTCLWFGIFVATLTITNGLSLGFLISDRNYSDVVVTFESGKTVEGVFVMNIEKGTFIKSLDSGQLILIPAKNVSQIAKIDSRFPKIGPLSCVILDTMCPTKKAPK